MEDNKKTIAESAQSIYEGFLKYNEGFCRITNRARKRFEKRDWEGHQQDIVARVDLYEKSVRQNVLTLRKILGQDVKDHILWNDIRSFFGERLENVPDAGFIKTFFNSITRRIFGTVGSDPQIEFISSAPDEGYRALESLSFKRYPYWRSYKNMFLDIFKDYSFNIAHKDIDSDSTFIASEVETHISQNFSKDNVIRVEFIDSFFYQAARAYMVGRIVLHNATSPIVIALKNDNDGICVDAVLLDEERVSLIFSYTRSYYFADPSSVVGAVQFLNSILPHKHIDELYTVLGRLRQGKTERYRLFTNHLKNSNDKFVHADGDKGLVMLVFTLPSYNLVFKIIRDKFGYPKTVKRQDVLDKYKLVSKHDLAGRLIDTQEFRKLEFPVNKFSEKLLKDLLTETGNTVRVHDDKLTIDHVYIERRVRPLNLYINEASRIDAELAILDYGKTLEDLAHTNIFPGDLLFKNFGVTRNKRVVFYDYDEVELVTDCNFRDIPDSNEDEELMNPTSYMYVNKHDIFPEEFLKFLSMDDEFQAVFLKAHGELLTPQYWRGIKNQHLTGNISLVVPYHQSDG